MNTNIKQRDRLGSWSYANKYDALYDKYSTNRNFNVNMWQEAFNRGEQDQYISFLEQNKDTQLSDKFYDPHYYDYETMMLELYKPFASATNSDERFKTVYDPVTNKMVEQSLGDMSDRQYIQYQLDEMYTIRTEEIKRQLEQWRKDQMSFIGKIGHDAIATVGELAEGFTAGVAGLVDFIVSPVAAFAYMDDDTDYLDAYVEYASKGLIALEKETFKAALDEYERTHTHFRDIDGNVTGVGKYFTGVANSIGMMIPSIITAHFTGGTSLAWMGQATFYASLFSNNMYETSVDPRTCNSPSWLKIANTAVKAGAEWVVEYTLNKLLGGTIQNEMLGMNRGILSKGLKEISTSKAYGYLLKSAAQEGLEEFMQDFSTAMVDEFTSVIYEGYGNHGVTFQTLVDSFVMGFLSSLVMSGGAIVKNGITSGIANRRKPGSGDLLIEEDGKAKKVRGVKRLYYSSILSDFQQALETIKKGKFKTDADGIELAQEVYGALSILSQYYASFDKQRIENCEFLLNRLARREDTSDEIQKKKFDIYAFGIQETFSDMLNGVDERLRKEIVEKTEKVSDKLKKGGTDNLTAVVEKGDNGEVKLTIPKRQKSENIAGIEEKLTKDKANDTLTELMKEYDYIFTTDGHVAVDEDSIAWIPDSWVENYNAREIRDFLTTTKLVEKFANDDSMKEFSDAVLAFVEKFTKGQVKTKEEAMTLFLFNDGVYQGFLLSRRTEGLGKFQNFVLGIHKGFLSFGSEYIAKNKRINAVTRQARLHSLNKVYDLVKKNMHPGTLKAILNWGINPQLVGADNVLNERDWQLVKEWEAHKNLNKKVLQSDTIPNAYKNHLEDIIASGILSSKYVDTIRKGLEPDATLDEQITSLAILNEVDENVYLEPGMDIHYHYSAKYIEDGMEILIYNKQGLNDEQIVKHLFDLLGNLGSSIRADVTWRKLTTQDRYLDKLLDVGGPTYNIWHRYVSTPYGKFSLTPEEERLIDRAILCLRGYENEILQVVDTLRSLAAIDRSKCAVEAMNITPDAFLTGDNLAEYIQYREDKIREFTELYGVTPTQMMNEDFTGMSQLQSSRLQNDMIAMGIDYDYEQFVIRKLEGLLGDDYIVTPEYFVREGFDKDGAVAMSDDIRKVISRIKSTLEMSVSESLKIFQAGRLEQTLMTYLYGIEDGTLYTTGDIPLIKKIVDDYKKDFVNPAVVLNNRETLIAELSTIRPSKPMSHKNYRIVMAAGANELLVPELAAIYQQTINLDEEYDENYEDPNMLFASFMGVDTRPWTCRAYDRYVEIYLNGQTITQKERSEIFDWINNYLSQEELNEMLDNYINPFTGEVLMIDGEFTSDEAEKEWDQLIEFSMPLLETQTAIRPLTDIVKIGGELGEKLKDWQVIFTSTDNPGDYRGVTHSSSKLIEIYTHSNDYMHTLIHEINHALQYELYLGRGGNPETTALMPDLLRYVFNHHRDFVLFADRYDDFKNIARLPSNNEVNKLPPSAIETLAYCAYRLIQGELWAEHYMHNGKLLPAYGMTQITDGTSYVVSPDGKEKFKIPDDMTHSRHQGNVYNFETRKNIKPDKTFAENRFIENFRNIFFGREVYETGRDPLYYRDTVHTRAYEDTSEIIDSLYNEDITPFLKWTMEGVNGIITRPDVYLSRELFAQLPNTDEGTVYYFVRDYVEKNFPGKSIDRDRESHKYIIVNDNAFDDLYNTYTASQKNNLSSNSLKERYEGETAKLSDIYDVQSLKDFGINPNIPIIFGENPTNNFVRTAQYPDGVITINTKNIDHNARFLDTVNHEFRHVVQSHHKFEGGFTSSFTVNDEMIAEFKKHVPELFKTHLYQKSGLTQKEMERLIVQQYTYLMVSGEREAFGIRANLLSVKPWYIEVEGGFVTVYTDWYNPKTAEGKLFVDYFTERADDSTTNKPTQKTKKPKKPKDTTEDDETFERQSTYVDITGATHISPDKMPRTDKKSTMDRVFKDLNKKSRYVSKEKAKGTNLEFFTNRGKNQIDPRLQEFIIKTTGHLDELPWKLAESIRDGILTFQAMMKWFRKVNLKEEVNDFTFNLINDCFFKNDHIANSLELDRVVNNVTRYWAACRMFLMAGGEIEFLLQDMDIDQFVKSIEDAYGNKYHDLYQQGVSRFDKVRIYDPKNSKRKDGTVDVEIDPDSYLDYMRVTAMLYFDGSPAGAFKMANQFHEDVLTREAIKRIGKEKSTSDTRDGGKGDKETTFEDTLAANKTTITGAESVRDTLGNNILAIYDELGDREERDIKEIKLLMQEKLFSDAIDEMIDDAIEADDTIDVEDALPVEFDVDRVREIMHMAPRDIKALRDELSLRDAAGDLSDTEFDVLDAIKYFVGTGDPENKNTRYYKAATKAVILLNDYTDEEIVSLYKQYTSDEAFERDVDLSKDTIKDKVEKNIRNKRVNIVGRIKRAANWLIEKITEGEITFSQLDDDVQAFFEYKDVETESGEKKKVLVAKSQLWEVGRGAVKLRHGRNIAEDQNLGHDVSQILENERLLKEQKALVKKYIASKNGAVKTAKKSSKTVNEKLAKNQLPVPEPGMKTVEFTVDKKSKKSAETADTTDTTETKVTKNKRPRNETRTTPTVFSISSTVDMPEPLRDILGVSFTKLADTQVQFVSLTEDGDVYQKNKKNARGILQHEVINWGLFYEINASKLKALTRSDILNIIDYFKSDAYVYGTDAGKFAAFRVFILGYIVDAARRRGYNNWNFSDAEVRAMEKLYEDIAHTAGSALQAVSQMKRVVNPYKHVEQRLMEDYGLEEDELDDLISAVDELQSNTILGEDTVRRKTEALIKRINELEEKMYLGDPRKNAPWTKRWFGYIKSYRYIAMLSSPMTWARNVVSNVVVKGFNAAADFIGNLFTKKGYREGQWNLNGVQVSPEVKNFIDVYITQNSDLFGPLYERGTKYTTSGRFKTDHSDRTLFVNMIVQALEQKIAANYRFPKKWQNAIANFVNDRISDRRFVEHAAKKYFSKILTLEIEAGNIDLARGLGNDVLELFAESIILANEDYMHKRSMLADVLDSLREKHPEAHEVLTFFQPFLNSGFNWFQEGLRYSPIGLISNIIKLCKLENQISKIDERRARGEAVPNSRLTQYIINRNIGKGIMGTLLITFGLILGTIGVLRIEDDDDKFYAVAGDVKIDISNIFGTSSILVGASISQLWSENPKKLGDVIVSAGNNLLEGFVLSDIIANHRYDKSITEFMLTETESAFKSFTPQVVQLLVRATNNEKIRYSSGFKGAFERYVNSFVPTQPMGARVINVYTGEVKTKYSIGSFFGEAFKGGLIGPKIFFEEITENERFCREYGINKGELSGELTINGKSYQLVDREALNVYYGKLNAQTIPELKNQRHYVKMPNGKFKTLPWDQLSKEQKKNVIERTMEDNAKKAKIWMWTQKMGNKYYGTKETFTELRKLGITTNVYRGDKGFVE